MIPPTPSICVYETGLSPKASTTAGEIIVFVAPVSQTEDSTSQPETSMPSFFSKHGVTTQFVCMTFTLQEYFLLNFAIKISFPQLSTNVLTLFLPHVPLEYLERQLSSRHDISFRTPL